MSDQVRAVIVAALASIPDIGRVHDRERYAAQSRDLLDLYGWPDGGTAKSRTIRGWFVSIDSERYLAQRIGRRAVVTSWRIVGLMSFDDAASSELLIADLARAVVDRLRVDAGLAAVTHRLADPSAGGAGTADGPQIVRIEPVMFAGVLCHRASIALTTEVLTP